MGNWRGTGKGTGTGKGKWDGDGHGHGHGSCALRCRARDGLPRPGSDLGETTGQVSPLLRCFR